MTDRSHARRPFTRTPKLLTRLIAPILAVALLAALAPNAEARQPANVRKPHVLMLGDSISMGYHGTVVRELEGDAVVIRPRENCAGTNKGVVSIDHWLALGDGKWDIIHFNFGLHDLKRVNAKTGKNSNDPKDPHQASPERYKKQLTEIVGKLKKTGARLIFATTTPVVEGVKPHRDVEDVKRYNAIAQAIAKEHGVHVNDLYSFALKQLAKIQRPKNVHFTPQGSAVLGKEVARVIDGHLQGIKFTEQLSRKPPFTVQPGKPSNGRPPNVVFVLADDLGWAELGSFGQEKIKTPHLDKMAAQGMRFTQFYCGNAVCAPSRCVLMTGKHPGQAYIRNNGDPRTKEHAALMKRLELPYPGQNPIPDSEVTIAEVLKQKGYATAAIGKWGLGHFGTTGDPNKQGFDLFFGFNCQRHAHTYYPGHLWRNSTKVALKNVPPVPGHAKLNQGEDPNDPKSYARFKGQDYSSDHLVAEALGFIEKNKEKPFFLYYPSLIPHLALHIPDEELKPYLGKWDETPFTGGGYTPHRTPRAAYAAMITRLDREVGQIMAALKKHGLDDNTLVIFSSDNGTTHLGKEADYTFFKSVGPLRGLKGSLYEGGIRVPTIARWPGKIKPGTTSDLPAAFWDIMPTFAEVTGTKAPADINGLSILPTLLGQPDKQKKHDHLYWEFGGYGGQQALRFGPDLRYKAVRQNMLRKSNKTPLKIELYDLKTDIGEKNDIAAKHPDLVKKAAAMMKKVRTPSSLFPLRPVDG